MNSQKCLHNTLLTLICLEIIAGILIVSTCEYTRIFLNDNIFQIDKHEVLSVVLIIKIYGLHVSMCFTGGIVVLYLFKDVYTRHLKICTILWIFLCIETVFGAILMSYLYSDTLDYVSFNFEESLHYGIKLYEADPQWVLIFDNLQYNYKCCGIHNHTDWKSIKLPKNHEPSIIKVSNQLVLLPYSCAKNDIATKTDENFNSRGCLQVITEIIDKINNTMMTINGFIAVDVVS